VKKLRILIADDHALVRQGAKVVIQARQGWKVVGEAANGREAVQKAIALKPDVVVVDIGMPELDGVEVARQIREGVPSTKVLVLTMHESDQMVKRALDAGALGYILKSDLTECLARAVKAVSEGKRFLTPKVSEIVLDGFLKARSQRQQGQRAGARITPRESEIIRLLPGSYHSLPDVGMKDANKEIAPRLGITVRTVETHRAKIMLKLGLHSLAELIHYAMRHGIATVQGDQ